RLSFYSSLTSPLSHKLTIDLLCCTHTFNIASTSLCWVGKNHKKCKMPGKKYNSTCSDTIQLKLNVRLRIALFDPRSFLCITPSVAGTLFLILTIVMNHSSFL